MNLNLFLSYFIQAASFASAVVLLVLQLRAFRRHHHRSFVLLTASTVCALLYFVLWQIAAVLASKSSPTPLWLYLCVTALLTLQIILGTWGTISLFKSYRHLSEKAAAGAETATHSFHAEDHSTTVIAEAPEPSIPPVVARPSILYRLNDVLRLWLLKGSKDISGMATEPWILTLALLTLGLWIGLDRLEAGPAPKFMSNNVPALGFYGLLALGIAFIVSRASKPRIPYRSALYLVTAVAPLFVGIGWLINTRALRAFMLFEFLLGIYVLLYTLLNLRRLTGARQLRTIALLLLAFGIFHVAERQTFWTATVWYSPPAEEEDYKPHQAESLLFDQRSKIDEIVQRFDDTPSETPKVFFLGFAGVGSQRVFAEEIKLGAHNVADRFNAKDRELLLLNDRRNLTTFPIATVTSLAYALKLVGQKMNPDRDILFLALSSHGSADPTISVSNEALEIKDLTGEDLTEALQASGIKRRIIVISACHAGAFIPLLQNPDTIIITAAAADKTSFGCSDDRDLTYFGEAFYRDALPKAKDLQDAFKQAKEAIAARETQEHQKTSDPQAYFGAELNRVLTDHPMESLSAR